MNQNSGLGNRSGNIISLELTLIHVNVKRRARYGICELDVVHAVIIHANMISVWLFACLKYGVIVAILDLRVRNQNFRI